MTKLHKRVTKALREADRDAYDMPDYEELARIAIKEVRKALK
jgi:hypothetical protein